jgi:hypothetical protein
MLAASAPAGVGAAALVTLYNVPHAVLRVWGLRAGWRSGTGLSRALAAPVLRAALRIVGPVAAVGLGFALPLVITRVGGHFDVAGWAAGAVAAVGTWVVARWLAPTLGAVRWALLLTAAVLLGTLM